MGATVIEVGEAGGAGGAGGAFQTGLGCDARGSVGADGGDHG